MEDNIKVRYFFDFNIPILHIHVLFTDCSAFTYMYFLLRHICDA